jgi:hypothetical protein
MSNNNFNQTIDIAWRAYRTLLKQEGLDSEAMSIAQQSYKDGWHECERQTRTARIEALEAALREIVHGLERFDDGKRDTPYGQGIVTGLSGAAEIARAALAPERP